ncbi:hypothetical protein EX30DRAFT_398695 [Ascodesmis nigricans]|uniref:Chromatin assembly factor 1 subunit A n=1 Tax=Ascodesmis nigricans TaxID=341454 RepID=A0A4S2MJP0_9PEZI|nr:hypothetical protein EX30DRAFT_398695 [Ascodesmis nigricans]
MGSAPPAKAAEAAPPSSSAGKDATILPNTSSEKRKRTLDAAGAGDDAATATTAATPKKPRLTKEEREAREKAKDNEKKKREDEKRKKEEEKKKREEAREEEKRKKEEEKRKKEEEKKKKEEEKRKKEEAREEERRRKEEERQKKERSQLRLNSFFVKPGMPKRVVGSSTVQKPVSIKATEGAGEEGAVEKATTKKKELSDYEKTFPPFFVKPNMVVAAPPFQRAPEEKRKAVEKIDELLRTQVWTTEVPPVKPVSKEEMVQLLRLPPTFQRRRSRSREYSTKDIIARINAPDDPGLPPIGPAARNSAKLALTPEYYLKLLNTLPHKSLKFCEDVRPPYSGTYTRKPLRRGLRRGARPFERSLPGVDYEYDSEAEWVAEEEGEELLSDEEEDDVSTAGSDDLEGFLDDEDEVLVKRGTLGALVAINSGLCWEDEKGRNPRRDLEEMRLEVLHDAVKGPIDPFSTAYWHPPAPQKTSMPPPPRQPLSIASHNNSSPSSTPSATASALASTSLAAAASAGKKLVPPEEMENFRAAIDGSDMTKAGLIEVLKKAFPRITKEAIKNTLDLVAERVGDRLDDKRWVLRK